MVYRLLFKKEILELKKKKIYVLSSFGHAGTDWLHSLLDGHKEILITPAFSYYRTYYRFLYLSKINIFQIKDYNYLAKIIADLFYFNPGYRVKRRRILFNLEEKKNFEKYFKIYIENDNDILEKKIFYAIHFAFLKIKKFEIKKIKNIVIHEHVAWHCSRYLKIFKSKFVLIFRDPKAALGGSFLRMKNSNKTKILQPYQFDMIILHMKLAFDFVISKKNQKHCYILQNEKMHLNLSQEMKSLAKWMRIKFSKTLLSQTFLNVKWLGESSYLAKDELKKELPKDFYDPSNVEKRWRNVLTKNDILMADVFFRKQINMMGYKLDNKLNFLKLLNGYLIFLFKYLIQENSSNKKYLIFFRNLVKRLFILINAKISLVLFKYF